MIVLHQSNSLTLTFTQLHLIEPIQNKRPLEYTVLSL